ncbi:Protein of unknown function (DUF2930 [Striga hermonthica]|uniref:Protein COFACTOR ASSEMBLY OF COMPLEX C SUBUNIT B CCB2, chloroplastic n=1 Tax=Striga hermonthica TaxID=68872 RepID=A0A9N7MLR3_STRHE|nr:Protein of unknown function (DUF2930 [Striga hermonthica]
MSTAAFSLHPSILFKFRAKHSFSWKFTPNKHSSSLAKICCSRNNTPQQQLNLSVLRFTLGIPGLDESYLPRYIGYAFGALLVLNHFVGSDYSSTTAAQLRTEALGLSLAAFSAIVPYLGKFLKGATPTDQKIIPEGAEQIFIMSEDVNDDKKADLAWGTYALLRNTNSISVLISVPDALCVRGYWNTPKDLSKQNVLNWFVKKTQEIGFSNLKDTMYFRPAADSELKEMVPTGIQSFLVQPILDASSQTVNSKGFVLLASSMDYAYTDKDKAWIAAIANKF